MTTKKYILIACGLLCLLSVAYGQKRETYFFSAEDMANIRSSAQTPWGKTIVDTLKSHIDERLKYPLAVPKEEAGHLHDYFCPVLFLLQENVEFRPYQLGMDNDCPRQEQAVSY